VAHEDAAIKPWDAGARKQPPTPTMKAAIGDAAFMAAMERNADIILMQCYAPLFVNVNSGARQWRPTPLHRQFTLAGDCRKGRRPSFDAAAPPEMARPLYEDVVRELRSAGLDVSTGEFQAMMRVSLVNDGPVTLLLDSRKRF